MAMMKVFALASSWAVCSVQADPCLTASGGDYKLSTLVLANIKCDSTSSACTAGKTSNCPCAGACCVKMPGVCSAIESSSSCGTDRLYDRTKKAVAATATNYDANCCKAKEVCSAHTCGTGYKDKTSKATLKCSTSTCFNSACCDPCTDCCMSMMTSGTSCPAATHYMSSTTAGATAANFEANCCAVKKTCDATCSAGMKQKAAYATIKCASSICSASECCETDATKCLAVTAACDANSFKDTAKNGVAGTTATVQTACCSAKTTCQQFSVHVDAAIASFAMLPQVHTVTFFFAIGLFIAGK